MSSKTKIVVLHMKEVIYTGIFLLLLVILGVVMFLMFGSGKSKTASSDAVSKYTPGIYRTSIRLNNNTFDVEVTVDQDQIQSIHLANLSESTSAMFPLVEPVLDSLSSQIYSGQSLDDLEYSSDQKYTALMLIHAIDDQSRSRLTSSRDHTSTCVCQIRICSSSFIHNAALASLGMRRSPRGDTATLPTFGPSGRQERLNCCMKNLR